MLLVFKTRTETDLGWWTERTELFARRYLGVEIKLWERFVIPETIPWSSAIPVFDPGGDFTNRKAVGVLRRMEIEVLEKVDVMEYSGSGANNGPTLRLIQNSIAPDAPDGGIESCLDLRGYALAFGVHFFAATSNPLDSSDTLTTFPNNLLFGNVPSACWCPDSNAVRFGNYGLWGRRTRQVIFCPAKN